MTKAWFAMQRAGLFLGIVVLPLLTTGCRPAAPPAVGPSTAAPTNNASAASTKVTLALNWFPEVEHGGYYAALVHGYFAEEGLDVTIEPGGPRAPVIAQVAAGRTAFCVDNADKLLLARAQDADVLAVLAPLSDSPRCLLFHEEAGIRDFDELSKADGITLAMNPGQPFAQFLTKTLKLDQVRMVPYPGNITQYLLDKRFAQQAYSFSEPFTARQNGAKPVMLMLSDLGFNTYTSALIASRQTVTSQPSLVAKMVRASQRGWQAYLQEPERTNAYIHQQNAEMSLDILAFGAEDVRRLCPAVNAETWGAMTAERWSTLVDQMERGGSLTAGQVRAADAFTNQFVEKP